MASQYRENKITEPIALRNAIHRDGYTVAQYATAALPAGTVMAELAASPYKLVPFTDETLTTGAAIPKFILAEAVDATAGDIAGVTCWISGEFAESRLNIENSKTLETRVVLEGTTTWVASVRDILRMHGMIVNASAALDSYENT